MVNWFSDYARVVFRELGPKVKIFTTLNEPASVCREGYDDDTKAPGVSFVSYSHLLYWKCYTDNYIRSNVGKKLYPSGGWICGHNMLKAHARAYHIYDKEFRPTQKGKIGIAIPCSGTISKIPGDIVSYETSFQFRCGWMAHPIFSETGDYPEIIKQRVANKSIAEGYPRSRLPQFSPKWIRYIRLVWTCSSFQIFWIVFLYQRNCRLLRTESLHFWSRWAHREGKCLTALVHRLWSCGQ